MQINPPENVARLRRTFHERKGPGPDPNARYTLRIKRAGILVATYDEQTRDEVAESVRDYLNTLESGGATFYVDKEE